MLRFALLVGLLFAGTIPAGAAERTIEFNRDVRPILSHACFTCHGFDAKTRKADLRLDTVEGATQVKDGVSPITPGALEKSDVWTRIISTDPN